MLEAEQPKAQEWETPHRPGAGVSPPRFVAATIASKPYLALARATARSFLEHNPDIPFVLLLADEEDSCIDCGSEPFRVLHIGSLPIAEPESFRFRHTELELSYAATPYLIDHLLGQGFDGVVFLKQETLVLDDLAPVLAKLTDHSALLTPHFLEPPGGGNALQRELNVLLAGVFNGGFMAFSNTGEARWFLSWWKNKTAAGCFWDVGNGLHFEQRWLDFAPSLMPNCHILRDPGINVGHWNLPERRVRVDKGRVTADGVPCRVFRFSGYQPERPKMVTKHNPEYTVESSGEAAAVFHRYRALLQAAGYDEARLLPYAYGRFDNGVAVTDEMRRIYHGLGDEARRFGNPFATAKVGSYYAWLKTREGVGGR